MSAFVSPIQVPLINGVVYSFAHISLNIGGIEFTGGFASIDYSRERSREKVMSNSPDPVGVTLGENAYEAQAEVYVAWWLSLLRTIEGQLGPGYGDQSFPIYVKYANFGQSPWIDQILNCHFDSTDAKNGKGTGALTRTIKFNPTKILFDGVDDLENPLVAPPQ